VLSCPIVTQAIALVYEFKETRRTSCHTLKLRGLTVADFSISMLPREATMKRMSTSGSLMLGV
jgi:hypothetical protein